MSIPGLGSSAPTAAWLGGQLSREQAQRGAEQLEAKAAALSAEAAGARDAADDAQRRADELQTQAGQARTRAEIGKQAVGAMRGMDRATRALSAALGRIADANGAAPSRGATTQDSSRPLVPLQSATGQGASLYTPAAAVRPALSVQPGQIVDLRV